MRQERSLARSVQGPEGARAATREGQKAPWTGEPRAPAMRPSAGQPGRGPGQTQAMRASPRGPGQEPGLVRRRRLPVSARPAQREAGPERAQARRARPAVQGPAGAAEAGRTDPRAAAEGAGPRRRDRVRRLLLPAGARRRRPQVRIVGLTQPRPTSRWRGLPPAVRVRRAPVGCSAPPRPAPAAGSRRSPGRNGEGYSPARRQQALFLRRIPHDFASKRSLAAVRLGMQRIVAARSRLRRLMTRGVTTVG